LRQGTSLRDDGPRRIHGRWVVMPTNISAINEEISMYLGLDLGTSGLKGLLIDEQQHVIDSVTTPLTQSRPNSGWSEQNPVDWIAAAESVLDQLKSRHPIELTSVSGIGLSGQMHGATLIDKAGGVLRPCILWNDTRSHIEAAELDADPEFRDISGNIVFPGFTAPKLLWVKKNEPRLFDCIDKVLLPKDYLRYWLTGEAISEMSDAAGTSWLDTAQRCWSEKLLNASGMDLDQMPALVEGTQVSGTVRSYLAQRWGWSDSVIVAGGAGDNAASAVGMGVITEGSAFVSLGTSGVLFAATAQTLPAPESAIHAFCHALPSTWHQMGVILSAASALDWYARLVGASAKDLTAELGDKPTAPGQEIFLPYLSGERTPHNNATIRGVFIGLNHDSDRKALSHTVLEGVAFALRDNLEALRAAGTNLNTVTAIGGGSQASYWLKLISTILGVQVNVPAEGDFGAAFGAARLGMIAATGLDPSIVCHQPVIAQTIEPDSSMADSCEQAYQRYRNLYPAICSVQISKTGH
jgi:xylulokinase